MDNLLHYLSHFFCYSIGILSSFSLHISTCMVKNHYLYLLYSKASFPNCIVLLFFALSVTYSIKLLCTELFVKTAFLFTVFNGLPYERISCL